MSRVFIKKYTYNGKTRYRSNFYGAYECHGKKHTVPLCKIMGTPPASLSMKDDGDAAYERSLQAATDMLKAHVDDARGRTDQVSLIRKALRVQSGHDIMERKIAELATLNHNRHRLYPISESESRFQQRVFDAFANFAKSRDKEYLYEIEQDFANEYFKELQTKQYSMTTIRKHIFTLSGGFKRFGSTGLPNPFAEIVSYAKSARKAFPITHRRPLTDDQVKKLLEYAKTDKLLYPLIICSLYGGFRLGDAATLRFSEVNWDRNLIHRTLLKTGETVNVPLIPPLAEVIKEAELNKKENQEFLFPEAAKLYSPNNPKLSTMIKVLMSKAIFGKPEDAEDDETPIERPTPIEVIKLVANEDFLQKKKDRINDVYSRYYSGQSYRQIEKETKYSRSQMSEDLAIVEKLSGKRIRPIRKKVLVSEWIAKTQEAGTSGRNKRSIYGIHSLRYTFIVNTVMKYNLPLQVAQKICGHTTIDMTEEYFTPNGTDIFNMFMEKFNQQQPEAESNNKSDALQTVIRLLEQMPPEQKALLKAAL